MLLKPLSSYSAGGTGDDGSGGLSAEGTPLSSLFGVAADPASAAAGGGRSTGGGGMPVHALLPFAEDRLRFGICEDSSTECVFEIPVSTSGGDDGGDAASSPGDWSPPPGGRDDARQRSWTGMALLSGSRSASGFLRAIRRSYSSGALARSNLGRGSGPASDGSVVIDRVGAGELKGGSQGAPLPRYDCDLGILDDLSKDFQALSFDSDDDDAAAAEERQSEAAGAAAAAAGEAMALARSPFVSPAAAAVAAAIVGAGGISSRNGSGGSSGSGGSRVSWDKAIAAVIRQQAASPARGGGGGPLRKEMRQRLRIIKSVSDLSRASLSHSSGSLTALGSC